MVTNAAGVQHLVGWVVHDSNGWRSVVSGGFTVAMLMRRRRDAVEALMRNVYGEDE